MCYYEKVYFVPCGHTEMRVIQHCHFARNDPNHQCFGAWNIRREWQQHDAECEKCTQRRHHLNTVGASSMYGANRS
ncbi:hypothetical protein CC80DRAFT_427589 [Byssothecium circinans]|uniref:Uncharacterized protein n=1 Tax=Byssothecium circinans TaxID=147558 RepID=A0A6A5TEN5_9PLEO|nr:hypothetical protein CC80DRAFT_427589 [Byssothecium circinans]